MGKLSEQLIPALIPGIDFSKRNVIMLYRIEYQQFCDANRLIIF